MYVHFAFNFICHGFKRIGTLLYIKLKIVGPYTVVLLLYKVVRMELRDEQKKCVDECESVSEQEREKHIVLSIFMY